MGTQGGKFEGRQSVSKWGPQFPIKPVVGWLCQDSSLVVSKGKDALSRVARSLWEGNPFFFPIFRWPLGISFRDGKV